jgi:acetyl-CoA C-acetyltransferase
VALQRYPEVEFIDHVHTAGNSSGIVDGAAAVLIGNAEAGQRWASSRARASAPSPRSAASRPSC